MSITAATSTPSELDANRAGHLRRPPGVMTLVHWRLRGMRNHFMQAWTHNPFKVLVVSAFALLFWGGLFAGFYEGLSFVHQHLPDAEELLLPFVFSLFFLALLAMLFFSNTIISLGALFKNRETAYLFAAPVEPDRLFLYKVVESLIFSTWAFLALAAPLMLAFGLVYEVSLFFYPAAALLFVPYTVLPACLGAIVALLVMRYLPRARSSLLIMAGSVLLIGGTIFALLVLSAGRRQYSSTEQLNAMVHSLKFAQDPWLPSTWLSEALLAVADGGWGLAVLQWATLLAAAFFLLSASGWLAVRVYPQAYDRAHGAGNRGGMVRAGIIDAAARLRPAGTRIPLLLVKDLKTFLRDPMQWSQVLIFFGILALYIANLRRFNYDLSNPFYKNLISFLNLSATSLTLAMLITRFVYPMLSLEGEKFWILGLVPLRRSRLLLGKFLFAFGGSLLITEVLMVLSHLTLHTGGSADRLLLLNCYTGALLCFGLSGLGVGMGALFPVFGESNPSKIVAGFGGTLTMVLALLYVTITIMVLALPCHWHFVTHQVGHGWIAAGLIASVVLSLIAGALPMALGARAFERLEF